MPEGHQLKIWTWSTSGTANEKTATILPGVPYQSNTALKEGATCYNTLWLYRESDGVVSRASEDEKIFLIEAPVVVPPPPSRERSTPPSPPQRRPGARSSPGSARV